MPNPNHTKPSSLRIPPDVKEAAQRRAAAEGRTLTDVIVEYLREYGACRCSWHGNVPHAYNSLFCVAE